MFQRSVTTHAPKKYNEKHAVTKSTTHLPETSTQNGVIQKSFIIGFNALCPENQRKINGRCRDVS